MINLIDRENIVEEVVRHLQAFYLNFKDKIPKPVRVGMEDLSPSNIKGLVHLVRSENEELPIAKREIYTSMIPFIQRLYYMEVPLPMDISVLCFTDDLFIFDQLTTPENTFLESTHRVFIGLRGSMVVLYHSCYPATLVIRLNEQYKTDFIYGEHMKPIEPKREEEDDASTRAFKHKRLLYTAIATVGTFILFGGVIFLIL